MTLQNNKISELGTWLGRHTSLQYKAQLHILGTCFLSTAITYRISRHIRRTVIFSLEILEKIMMNVY
jgi:hypothetical protein